MTSVNHENTRWSAATLLISQSANHSWFKKQLKASGTSWSADYWTLFSSCKTCLICWSLSIWSEARLSIVPPDRLTRVSLVRSWKLHGLLTMNSLVRSCMVIWPGSLWLEAAWSFDHGVFGLKLHGLLWSAADDLPDPGGEVLDPGIDPGLVLRPTLATGAVADHAHQHRGGAVSHHHQTGARVALVREPSFIYYISPLNLPYHFCILRK